MFRTMISPVLLFSLVATACGDDGDASGSATAPTSSTTADGSTGSPTSTDPTTDQTSDATSSGTTGTQTTEQGTGGSTGGGDEVVVVGGFDLPESVHWSAEEDAWFVSNIAGMLGVKDGDGFISKLDADGTVAQMQWVTGLDGPGGLRAAGGTLFVADIDRLHAIDIATATITESVTIEGAQFLNDVAVGTDGFAFVSDTFTNSVHAWKPGEAPTMVITDPGLKGANGLIFMSDALHVAGVGSITPDDGVFGQIVRVEEGTGTALGSYEGKLDGIEVDGADFLVTEFSGKLQRVSADGATVTTIRDFAGDGLMSTADLGFDPVARVVGVPDLLGGQVAFYPLP